MSIKHSEVSINGETIPGHHFKRKQRNAIVDIMMSERLTYPKKEIKEKLPDVSMDINLKKYFESAMNTDILKIMHEDLPMCTDILVMRYTNNDYIVDLTLGEILLYMAEYLRNDFGGSKKYWLMVMFSLMGLEEKQRINTFGEVFSDISRHWYWQSTGGYGIFADDLHRVTNKPLSFSKELYRFTQKLKA